MKENNNLSALECLEKSYLEIQYRYMWSGDEFIIYTVLFLLLSVVDNVNEALASIRVSSMKINRLLYLILHEIGQKNAIITDIVEELHSFKLDGRIIDITQFRSIINEFPFSIDECNSGGLGAAITPAILSKIVQSTSYNSSSPKKIGKYYTKSVDAEFLVKLSLLRYLQNEISELYLRYVINNFFWSSYKIPNEQRSSNETKTLIIEGIDVLDPACGSGEFLIQFLRCITSLKAILIIKDLQLWGNDLEKKALQITRLRVHFFNLSNGSNYRVKTTSKNFVLSRFDEQFDLIIGNPPWVRHEDIIKQSSNIKELSKLEIDKKSDLYIYFCLLGIKKLKEHGILAFITSNAWLEVKYGKTLQKVLLDETSFEIIYNSRGRLWRRLGVNAIFLVAKKVGRNCEKVGLFTELRVTPQKIPLESLYPGLLTKKEYRDKYYRIELIEKEELRETNKWAGSFLRLDRKERRVLEVLSRTGIPLSQIAEVKFGVKTGVNDFFYLKKLYKSSNGKIIRVKNRLGWEGWIEEDYLIPVIKTPSSIVNYAIEIQDPTDYLFYCPLEKKEVKEKAHEYISWGEESLVEIKQGKKSGTKIKVKNIRSLKNRKNWYSIPEYQIPNLLWCKSYHNRPGCFYVKTRALPDQRFYSIYLKKEFIPLVFIYLNSSLVWVQMEVYGNTNMGYGVLDTNVYWLKSLRIPVEMLERETMHDQAISLMAKLLNEPTRKSIIQECKIRSEIDLFFARNIGINCSELNIIRDVLKRNLNSRLKI